MHSCYLGVMLNLISTVENMKIFTTRFHGRLFTSVCFCWLKDQAKLLSAGSFIWANSALVGQFDTVAISLPTDQEVPDSIPGYAMAFFLGENYSTVCKDWVFLRFIEFCLCSVLCCIRRRALYSPGKKSGQALQLDPCSFVWSIET